MRTQTNPTAITGNYISLSAHATYNLRSTACYGFKLIENKINAKRRPYIYTVTVRAQRHTQISH